MQNFNIHFEGRQIRPCPHHDPGLHDIICLDNIHTIFDSIGCRCSSHNTSRQKQDKFEYQAITSFPHLKVESPQTIYEEMPAV